MSPKVSIIMGIYNCASTLPEAIDSIVSQTFSDWELIMCDDGSTDHTYQVALEYAQNDPNRFILLRNKKNQGLNITLNRCLREATGEYIARMDGDDISLPDRLQIEVDFLDTHPEYALVSTPMLYFDETGIWGQGSAIEIPKIEDFVFHAPFHSHAPCMIRHEAFFSVSGYSEDPRLLRYEDCNLWYKLYSAGYRGYNIQQPLYMMRDDRTAYKRRTFSSRFRAVYVQYSGFRMIQMPAKYYPYLLLGCIKCFLLAFMPSALYDIMHKWKLKASPATIPTT